MTLIRVGAGTYRKSEATLRVGGTAEKLDFLLKAGSPAIGKGWTLKL